MLFWQLTAQLLLKWLRQCLASVIWDSFQLWVWDEVKSPPVWAVSSVGSIQTMHMHVWIWKVINTTLRERNQWQLFSRWKCTSSWGKKCFDPTTLDYLYTFFKPPYLGEIVESIMGLQLEFLEEIDYLVIGQKLHWLHCLLQCGNYKLQIFFTATWVLHSGELQIVTRIMNREDKFNIVSILKYFPNWVFHFFAQY